ncbi:facilitated trehalose transporter Tret1-like [Augochlora pura]
MATREDMLRRRLPQYFAASAACMGGFSLGCGIGWSAPCVELLSETGSHKQIAIDLVASIFPLGAALGVSLLPFVVDKIGRKWTMMCLVPPFIVGWILISSSINMLPLMIIGRLLTGACGGMTTVVAPMYTGEIAEKEIRGTLGVFFQLFLVTGVLYAYCCGYSKNIAIVSILCGLPPVLFAVLMFFMPESPMYFTARGNIEAAKKSMRFFRGPDFDIEPEIAAFAEEVARTRTDEKATLLTLMKPPLLKTMLVALGMMFSQQFSGINAIIFYGETIFKQTGVDMDSLLQVVIFAVVQVISCVIAASLIDQLGRKFLMVLSTSAMSLCLIALGIFFVLKDSSPDRVESIHWLPLLSSCVYILAFCLGSGPIPWSYMSEIFPANVKGAAASCASCCNWILAFIVTMAFSSAVDAVGTAIVLFFFAVICGLSVVFVMMCMVETKGKTFEEIQRAFGSVQS